MLEDASDPLTVLMSLGENEGVIDRKAWELGQTFSLTSFVSIGSADSSSAILGHKVVGTTLVIVQQKLHRLVTDTDLALLLLHGIKALGKPQPSPWLL